MKRTLFLVALLLGLCLSARGQSDSRSFGFHFGYPAMEATYQHIMADPHFLQVDLGVDLVGGRGFRAVGTYNWVYAQPDWGGGDWALYAGPGVALGYLHDRDVTDRPHVVMAVVLQAGIEFAPWRHFAVSLDIRPMYGYYFGTKSWYRAGLYGLIPSLGVRYLF